MTSAEPDGRSARWASHREARRLELVEAAVSAIDQVGPDAGISEIAAAAGVSKPVIYRYFTDKADVHAAVGRWGAQEVLARILPALEGPEPMRHKVRLAIAGYLDAIQTHPQVFLLLVQHRVDSHVDPLADGKAAVANAVEVVIRHALVQRGLDASPAGAWAQGIVGASLAVGEWWVTHQELSYEQACEHLHSFVWGAMIGTSQGLGIAASGASRDPLSEQVDPGL